MMALVGNKADLQDKREVPVQVSAVLSRIILSTSSKIWISIELIHSCLFLKDGTDYAEKNGMFFIETSAKTADNINQLFEVFLISLLHL